jgi:hypothetical protein
MWRELMRYGATGKHQTRRFRQPLFKTDLLLTSETAPPRLIFERM